MTCPSFLSGLKNRLAQTAGSLGILMAFATLPAQAQLSTNPPDVSWRQINTEKFQVIFPEGFERDAQHVANTLQYIHAPLSRTLGQAPRKIPVILQNRNAIANGFVTLAPRRSEFYTTPPQDYTLLGTNRWLDLLAVHEFRHVVQYDKTRQGAAKIMYYVFGDYGLSFAGNVALPNWFWEGDAVGAETAFTASGRGRIPDFDLLYRTNTLTRKPYSYNKQHLGSFKDPVPNHYVLGYHFTNYGRRHYGPNFWGKIVDHAAGRFFIPFIFSKALRYETGYRLPPFYRRMQHELDSLWTQQAESITETPATVLNPRTNETYTNYEYPNALPDGSIIALKSGLGDVPQFVKISADGQQEQHLFTPGPLNSAALLSVAQNKIAWAEFEFDPRWDVRTYSVVKTYDITTGKLNVLQRKTRLAAPVLSPDARRIAAVEATLQNEYTLVLLDADTGAELKRIPAPNNDFISMPRWSPDGKKIVLLRTANGKRTISLVDTDTGIFTDVLLPTSENIGHPVLAGNYVYFNAPYTGIENVFALDLTTKKQYQVTSRKLAGTNATLSPNGEYIFFNDFSKEGYNIARTENNPANWQPLENIPKQRIQYYQPWVEQEGQPDLLTGVPKQTYPVQKYSKYKHLFKPHSWAPTIGPTSNALTATIYAQDLLSTTISSAGFTYNTNENSGRVFAGVSYQGLYPIINVTGATGSRAAQENDTTYYWKEHSLTAGLQVPLNLTRSRYRVALALGADAAVTRISGYDRPRESYEEQTNGVLRNMHYNVAYNRTYVTSKRDLAGKFEQRLAAHFYHTPFGGDYQGNLLAVTTRLAFPGIFKHHSFQVGGNYQHQSYESYRFTSPILYPRGYSYRPHENFISGFAQYKLPVWYPDLALGPVFYFQRVKANVFYDYGKGFGVLPNNRQTRFYESVGAELSTDFNFMRLSGLLLDIGVRVAYLPREKDFNVQLLLLELGF